MKKISAAEFMKTHKQEVKNSKLEPYRDDILLLKEEGYTQQQIMDFLKLNGVSVGMTTLNWFIRSRTGKAMSSKKQEKTGGSQVQTKNRQTASVSEKQDQASARPEKQTEPEKTKRPIIGKFNMNRQFDPEDLY